MTQFVPIKKLDIFRRLSNNERVLTGVLAQNSQGVYFQYDSDYLLNYPGLSPFNLPFDSELHQAPREPHQGLHGVFTDSLPDGWGSLLMNRVFRQHGILPHQLTAMDRLAYIGSRGMGALEYCPTSDYATQDNSNWIDVVTLGEEAQLLYDGQTETVLAQLANAGSSGGARPKAQIYLQRDNTTLASTIEKSGLEPWLVKFTSASLDLGHEEGLCEAAYLTMAAQAGIDVPQWQLITPPEKSPAIAWLALRRFDCSPQHGRYHFHSLAGLLDVDFRTPAVDYETLIKASQILCNSPVAGQKQFARAIFNLFSLNQDDHSKNWAFLQQDNGEWQLAPFYDVTFSPTPYGEHSTSFVGYGKNPPLKAIQQLAAQANFENYAHAQEVIEKVVSAIHNWQNTAMHLNIKAETRKLIAARLNDVYQQNKPVLSK
ncbi:TPA: type II toxin-antitoxin system HipA family toxin [Yersinia enterocolitica]